MSAGWYLLIALGLLLANGFFVAAEFGLVAARRSKMEQLSYTGDIRARLALSSVRELSLMLAGAQLGITMASLGLGHVAEPAVANIMEAGVKGAVDLPPSVTHSIAVVIALTIVVFLHMVIGEMAPKNIAISGPERTALRIAIPFRLFVTVFRPFIRLLNALANATLRLLRVEPRDEIIPAHSAKEFQMMIQRSAREGALGGFEHRLLSAIGFTGRDAGAVMVPRTEMVAVPTTVAPDEIERLVLETGHSRYPVYSGDREHVIGFFHAKDLLKIDPVDRDRALARRFVRPMLVVPESRKLYPLLLDMRRERKHFALVIDEHGGTAGIVTLEDVLEELVGEIRDEYDVAELDVETIGEGSFLVPGSLRIDEAAERLGIPLPEGDYETVAGFLMDRLGRIPKRRDAIEHDGWRIRVRSMRRRRVVQVMIERLAPPEEGSF